MKSSFSLSYPVVALLLVMALTQCQLLDFTIPESSLKVVLSPNKGPISLKNRFGELKLDYAGPTERVFTWNGNTRSISLSKTRIGDIYSGSAHFKAIDQIHRAVYEEGIKLFATQNEYREWRDMPYHSLYFDAQEIEGNVLVGFNIDPYRNQIGIELWHWKIVSDTKDELAPSSHTLENINKEYQ